MLLPTLHIYFIYTTITTTKPPELFIIIVENSFIRTHGGIETIIFSEIPGLQHVKIVQWKRLAEGANQPPYRTGDNVVRNFWAENFDHTK